MAKSKITGKLTALEARELLDILKNRFEKNMRRHKGVDWNVIQKRLEAIGNKLWSLSEMEKTGGEPDVIGYDKKADRYLFVDCAEETPKGRRSLCYDLEALESRTENKPRDSALSMADEMGITLLDESRYRELQKVGPFDKKTSSWLATPEDIRALGGALFGDFRYGHIFIYHNGAESYFAARGFRGMLEV